jgi:hypothetical protein
MYTRTKRIRLQFKWTSNRAALIWILASRVDLFTLATIAPRLNTTGWMIVKRLPTRKVKPLLIALCKGLLALTYTAMMILHKLSRLATTTRSWRTKLSKSNGIYVAVGLPLPAGAAQARSQLLRRSLSRKVTKPRSLTMCSKGKENDLRVSRASSPLSNNR